MLLAVKQAGYYQRHQRNNERYKIQGILAIVPIATFEKLYQLRPLLSSGRNALPSVESPHMGRR